MITWLRRFFARLAGTAELPEEFTGTLAEDEHVLAVARGQHGAFVATYLGLWLPDADGFRRVGWHLISKATWGNDVLTVIEAEEIGTAGSAVLLRDLAARRFTLREPRRLPDAVRTRVTGSIRSSHHRELPGGGAWFVQRKIPGQDGIVLQVRGDRDIEQDTLRRFAEEVAAKVNQATYGEHG